MRMAFNASKPQNEKRGLCYLASGVKNRPLNGGHQASGKLALLGGLSRAKSPYTQTPAAS